MAQFALPIVVQFKMPKVGQICVHFSHYFIIHARYSIFGLGRGSTFPNVSQDQLLTIPIPLPPISEQKAIVAKIEGLLENVSSLESENKAQQIDVQRLMGAVLQEAFGGR